MKNLTEMRYIPTKKQLKERVTTISSWQLPKQESALAPAHVWTNADMDPVKPEDQTWNMWTWMAYWGFYPFLIIPDCLMSSLWLDIICS
jgi:NCS1 family nucleobase:cation symporter-1